MELISVEKRHQQVLWNILHVSLWDPPPAGLRPREVLDLPAVAIYAADWGQPTDIGVLAADGEIIMGGCWSRLLKTGLGYVNDETPQLGIALFPDYQRKGLGTVLMMHQLDSLRGKFPAVALTVHPQNQARILYEKCGFVLQREVARGYLLMLAKL
ncbi:GNAT family N-acetyltransferase [Undibacterium sp.]|jgi:ribosomal protein S18 acetylase RimI-like enzyme|uniref:GNAT family N-acetyltransferase n=1 Tax=Undibacterium sp. TaxID=1914977 RepID=UPI002C46294F|nr:GNAT family N-acetyltransferase [Undibacterium sp.]HTD07067.1 GNAT family N-acetyltransferase [Undibacterium sp.]